MFTPEKSQATSQREVARKNKVHEIKSFEQQLHESCPGLAEYEKKVFGYEEPQEPDVDREAVIREATRLVNRLEELYEDHEEILNEAGVAPWMKTLGARAEKIYKGAKGKFGKLSLSNQVPNLLRSLKVVGVPTDYDSLRQLFIRTLSTVKGQPAAEEELVQVPEQVQLAVLEVVEAMATASEVMVLGLSVVCLLALLVLALMGAASE